jgi:hypothetical protein
MVMKMRERRWRKVDSTVMSFKLVHRILERLYLFKKLKPLLIFSLYVALSYDAPLSRSAYFRREPSPICQTALKKWDTNTNSSKAPSRRSRVTKLSKDNLK